MYSLPITTYFDYWRATKVWTSYLGGLAVFAAGTRFSTLGAPDITQALLPVQQTSQSLNTKSLSTDVVFSGPRRWASSQEVSQGATNQDTIIRNTIIQGAVSRGIFAHGAVSRGITSQETPSKEILSKEVLGQEAPSHTVTSQEMPSQEVPGQELSSQRAGDRVTSRIQVEEKEIPYDTQYVESDKLLPGTSQIQEEGEKGILRQVVKSFEAGGQLVDQQIQASLELKSPKTEVILRNSKPVSKKKVIIRNSNPAVEESFVLDQANIRKTLTVESTAYTFTGNKTATGVSPREGLIAVDPKVIAMGSKVYVEGYGYAIAADTGGDIRGNRIDVFFSTLRQCIDWGRKPVHIYVLKPT